MSDTGGARGDLDARLEEAARRGAKAALAAIGLNDGCASKDVRDLRDLLHAWRDVRKTARRTVVAWVIRLALLALVAGVLAKTGLPDWVKL